MRSWRERAYEDEWLWEIWNSQDRMEKMGAIVQMSNEFQRYREEAGKWLEDYLAGGGDVDEIIFIYGEAQFPHLRKRLAARYVDYLIDGGRGMDAFSLAMEYGLEVETTEKLLERDLYTFLDAMALVYRRGEPVDGALREFLDGKMENIGETWMYSEDPFETVRELYLLKGTHRDELVDVSLDLVDSYVGAKDYGGIWGLIALLERTDRSIAASVIPFALKRAVESGFPEYVVQNLRSWLALHTPLLPSGTYREG